MTRSQYKTLPVKATLPLVLILVLAVFLLAVPRPVAASCGGNTAVGDETALNNAISAFNSLTNHAF